MRILVVDDDAMAGELTAAVLAEQGHDVLLVADGVAAAERLDADAAIHLVICDMNMPLVSGIDLFRMLRAQGDDRPFILLTGDDPAGLLAKEPALDACLLKNFSLEEDLPRTIDAVLARRA